MFFVGLFAVVIGVLTLTLGILRADAGTGLAGVLYLVIGGWTARAGGAFRSVAVTTGHDISSLMAALDDLRKVFTLQYWLCLVALVLALLLLLSPALGGAG
jgi:hypothetical protein